MDDPLLDEDSDDYWDDLDISPHHCHPHGSLGDSWTCPECGKEYVAKPTILWQQVS